MHMRTLVVYPNLRAVASGSQRHLVMAYVASHMYQPQLLKRKKKRRRRKEGTVPLLDLVEEKVHSR